MLATLLNWYFFDTLSSGTCMGVAVQIKGDLLNRHLTLYTLSVSALEVVKWLSNRWVYAEVVAIVKLRRYYGCSVNGALVCVTLQHKTLPNNITNYKTTTSPPTSLRTLPLLIDSAPLQHVALLQLDTSQFAGRGRSRRFVFKVRGKIGGCNRAFTDFQRSITRVGICTFFYYCSLYGLTA